MTRSAKKHTSGCLIAYGLNAFGDRWSLLIIREIMLYGRKTYSDFLAAEEGFATNILADRLKSLEANGILEKARSPDNRRSFLYSLTEKGYDLAPVMMEIMRWSGNHAEVSVERRERLEALKSDPVNFEAKLRGLEPV